MFDPQHHGLIFSSEQFTHAKEQREHPIVQIAWDAFNRLQPVELLKRLHINAVHFALEDDMEAGLRGLELLERATETVPDADNAVGQARIRFSMMQAVDLLLNHPDFSSGQQSQIDDWINEQVDRTQKQVSDLDLVERLWAGVELGATAVLLEQESLFQQTIDLFKATIDDDVRPEGHLVAAVEAPEIESMRNQLLSAQALTLIAEMGAKAGVDLWKYENRSVSVRTAATYPLYYYYYPEEWPWCGDPDKPSKGVDLETAQALYQQHSGFLELTRPHFAPPLKAIEMILGELRPIYDWYGGGPVTLLYGHIERKRRGFLKWL